MEDGGYHEFWVLQTKISILGHNGKVYKPVGGWVDWCVSDHQGQVVKKTTLPIVHLRVLKKVIMNNISKDSYYWCLVFVSRVFY